MRSLADRLPHEIARLVHPDWRKNERDYWSARDALLGRCDGQWIAFADGEVIASDDSPVEVFRAARESGSHPFVIRVGCEDVRTQMRERTTVGDKQSWTVRAG
jgi:hypothetical protein